MLDPLVTREDIRQVVRRALEPLETVHALWEGGAAAFDRIDEWSDIDLQVDVDDEHVGDVFAAIEQALQRLSPIELKWEVPQPVWHGHAQIFYRLRDASQFLLIDLVVMKHSSTNKFLEPEIHGQVIVHFDKSGVVQPKPLDRRAWAEQLQARLKTVRVLFNLTQVLTLKELNRHNDIEALAFYHSYTLRPLVEVLRMRYKPEHYNFSTRYIYYDLPPEVVRSLEPLFFVAIGDDLCQKRQRAETWFYETVEQLERESSGEAFR